VDFLPQPDTKKREKKMTNAKRTLESVADQTAEMWENGNPSSFIESFNEMHKKDQGEFLLLCADRTDDRFNLSWNHEVARKCLKFVIKDKYGVSL